MQRHGGRALAGARRASIIAATLSLLGAAGGVPHAEAQPRRIAATASGASDPSGAFAAPVAAPAWIDPQRRRTLSARPEAFPAAFPRAATASGGVAPTTSTAAPTVEGSATAT